MDKKPPRKRNRRKVTDRPEVRAVLVKAHYLKLTSKHAKAYSYQYVAGMILRETDIKLSRITVQRGLIDHKLHKPWRRKD
ncbi:MULTISPECIES: hypothetical protein [Paraburkholderia]|uniref:hypothetical protein n=1 Tax=Paraburkholderia TaxID=1822464 RepID=UPI00036A0A83|nr:MULTISPECIES: hypothetical protein [Paraburkholderia]MDH6147262.1 hypothetical protein [Paraburkholderia sp. WSM4179]